MHSLMINDTLLQIHKPARYIGQEWNVAKKNFDESNIRVALCFPDLYEVGMSNLGMRILYGIANSIEDVCCERFFSVDTDLEDVLRKDSANIFSLESRRRLGEFDIAGFSLSHELCYSNVLNMLELSGIPLESSLRDSDYPLIIAGGTATLNPEPMHEFFDFFVIGEAEEALPEIIDVYRKYKNKFKSKKLNKQDLLTVFSQIEGIYVPSLYEVCYQDNGELLDFKPIGRAAPAMIRKRFVRDINRSYFPRDWLIPHIQIVNDRITLEIMRGCPNRCYFCQARSYYSPFRYREAEEILNTANQIYKNTGYEEISLGGLSVSDYPGIEDLIEKMLTMFKDKAVGISLPSIRPKDLVGKLSLLISTVKKTGLTFAPEAGTTRLRRILNKDFDPDTFFKALQEVYKCGYRHVKLYFMIGIPYETDDDLDTIISFAERVSQIRRVAKGSAAEVNVSINTLIPKPHTPFQWFKMPDTKIIEYKQNYLKKRVRNKKLNFSYHNRYMSVLEAILSRGDRRLSRVIYDASRNGAKFDAWGNHFVFQRWLEAFSEAKIDPNYYLEEKSFDNPLPWDFIDIGITKDRFISEVNSIKAVS